MKNDPEVNITVSESGSGNGAKSLINGTCHIAAMSRFMKSSEYAAAVGAGVTPVAHIVALDALAVIVHPGNPVTGLTLPFLSYGGSHLLTTYLGIGILMGMRAYSRPAHRDSMGHEFLGTT